MGVVIFIVRIVFECVVFDARNLLFGNFITLEMSLEEILSASLNLLSLPKSVLFFR